MFHWSKLAKLHPCENDHPNRLSKFRQYFDEKNIDGFNFSNGFKFSDVQKFQKTNNLSIDIIELSF